MSSPLDLVTVEMLELGQRANSRFDTQLFRALTASGAARLWELTESAPHAEALLRSYMRLLVEAVGMGCMTRDADGAHRNLLSLLLVDRVPERLVEVAPERRAQVLATAWNIGEGLLQEPAWMNRYVTALCADLVDLSGLAGYVEVALEPVLTPRPFSQWKGECSVQVLDPRALRDDFLPGPMHLAAPTVVCVHDRRLPRTQVSVFLDHGGRSRILGATPCLGARLHEGALPAVEFSPNALTVAERKVSLPWLRAPHETLVTATGFVLASSIDSQRLWVVDAP